MKEKKKTHGICWDCHYYMPDDRAMNCNIANRMMYLEMEYNVKVECSECPKYKEIGNNKKYNEKNR